MIINSQLQNMKCYPDCLCGQEVKNEENNKKVLPLQTTAPPISDPWAQILTPIFSSFGGFQVPLTKTNYTTSHNYPKYEIWATDVFLVEDPLKSIFFSFAKFLSNLYHRGLSCLVKSQFIIVSSKSLYHKVALTTWLKFFF